MSNKENANPIYLLNFSSNFFKVFIAIPPFHTLFKIVIRIDILTTYL